MAHIAEMPIVRSMHGYVLCEYALTFQKTHFHPYCGPAGPPAGAGARDAMERDEHARIAAKSGAAAT